MTGPRWQGADWLFTVLVCPVCHAQVDESGEDGGVCWEHSPIASGVQVELRVGSLDVLAQLGHEVLPAEAIGALILERIGNARRMEAENPEMRRSAAHQCADIVFEHDLPRLSLVGGEWALRP